MGDCTPAKEMPKEELVNALLSEYGQMEYFKSAGYDKKRFLELRKEIEERMSR